MQNKIFMNCADVCDALGIGEITAYKIIRELNTELKRKGKIVIRGRVSKEYFLSRYNASDEKK